MVASGPASARIALEILGHAARDLIRLGQPGGATDVALAHRRCPTKTTSFRSSLWRCRPSPRVNVRWCSHLERRPGPLARRQRISMQSVSPLQRAKRLPHVVRGRSSTTSPPVWGHVRGWFVVLEAKRCVTWWKHAAVKSSRSSSSVHVGSNFADLVPRHTIAPRSVITLRVHELGGYLLQALHWLV